VLGDNPKSWVKGFAVRNLPIINVSLVVVLMSGFLVLFRKLKQTQKNSKFQKTRKARVSQSNLFVAY
jgi:hypothetical protein